MGFFETFLTWLNGQLDTFIGTELARVAAAIEPAAITLATIYVMFWGYLHLAGKITEPILDGARRVFTLAVILGVGLRLWTYNSLLVDTFFRAPGEFASALVGATSPVGSIDQLWLDGQGVAETLLDKASLFDFNVTYPLVGLLVYLLVGLTCVYAVFLMALASIAIAVLLALGPLFILMLLFDSTKRFFEAWTAQLATYALISILIALVAALLLSVVRAYATAAVAGGSNVTIAEAVRLCAASILIFLVMRQVTSIAAILASGVALSSYSAMSRTLAWAWGKGSQSAYQFGRGVFDRDTTRYDLLKRKAGYYTGQGVRALARAVWRRPPRR